ncbi:putative bifunctional diguanylate cyclase/phosphodiesterase [Vibrio salinus]|uniref:putative bifunctional diguanylate cyclase/phosphodiesterase n=1 Tax=Vibrio salinus TaxID=2899784 RepID=UPI001E36F1CD|nr:GGDEF domain-containing phosphodiesterase [Vibrio salinus]MCE0495890.1 EAL domain-containing protein [Vibrio salinus]
MIRNADKDPFSMYAQERLKVFSFNMITSVIVNLFVATVLVVSPLYADIGNNKYLWLGILFVICIIRLFVAIFARNDPRYKMNLHFWGVVSAGVIWALFPYIFNGVFDFKEEMITIVVFCGMAGGGATLLNADLRSSIVFTTIIVLPYSVLLLLSSEPNKFALGILGIGFWVALTISSYQCAKFISSGIRNKAKLDDMVDNLELKVKERTAQIIRLEERDMLTELNNRNSFLSKVELNLNKTHIEHHDIHAVLYIDMRGFKILNNTYGHLFGDHVLSTLGTRFRSVDKFYDSISGRWGSDEFVLYVESLSRIAIKQFLKYLQETLTKEIRQHNIKIVPSYHIGIRIYKEHEDIVTSVRKAYHAVQEGKQKNLRICHFSDEIQRQTERKEFLRRSMEESLKQEAFYLHYQPIVNVTTNEIDGYEALVRWTLNGEIISPAEFVSVAEEHGLIINLGKLVLKKSLMTLHEINKINSNVSMSINVSVIQFQDDEFPAFLDFYVKKYQINPANVHLEITETVLIENLEKLSNAISEIKKRGILISIDDFGTGFSSISVLKSLAIDFIKIDKIYIDNICNEGKDKSIVEAVTKMSHLIGCQVIAEGIEEQSQLEKLIDIEADFYQGFYFSRPVDIDKALAFLNK